MHFDLGINTLTLSSLKWNTHILYNPKFTSSVRLSSMRPIDTSRISKSRLATFMSTLDFKTLFVPIEANSGSDYSGLISMQVEVEVRYSKFQVSIGKIYI